MVLNSASKFGSLAGLLGLTLILSGCGGNLLGSSSNSSLSNIFGSSKATTTSSDSAAGVGSADANTDIECPSVDVRLGAATLTIGSKPGDAEPSAMDLRYQGSIIRTARECKVVGGVMTMKVGIEGRVITGPAGGPGNIEVPLRLAVVKEGIAPKPILSKFARVPVTITGAIDRVTFTHVDSEISFPMPVPAADIDSYVVYVGFDSMATPPPKRPAAKRASKPKQS
ncbi:MAG TPA: hypothetical protein VGM57_09230 [Pseudolabrys sp.]